MLIDENSNAFRVRNFEHIRLIGDIPEWYFKTPPMVITGDSWEIGNYLTHNV